MRQGYPTTPRKVSGSIKRFVRTLGTGTTPRLLRFTLVSEKYLPRYCLNNVEAEHKTSGDPIVFGWVIWEDQKRAFIEAEFHGVISRGDELIDLTPRVDGEEKLLFVPDPNRSAERIDAKTWRTWSNQKSLNGHVYEDTRVIEIEDTAGNVIA